MSATTTIRLPPELRERVQALAEATGRSAHSVIIDAIERQVAYEERVEALVRAARSDATALGRLGQAYPAADVHAWLERLAAGEPAARPAPWRP